MGACYYFSFEILIVCWLLSRPKWRIVSKLTTDVVTYCADRGLQSKIKICVPENILLQKSTDHSYTDHVRLLGVTISSDLSSEKHVSILSWVRRASTGSASFDGSVDHSTLSLRRYLNMPSSHLLLTTATPCWPGRQSPPLTGSSRCWMR